MRWSLDPQGAVAHVSREWKQFTGFTKEYVAGKANRPSVHPSDQALVADVINDAVDKRSSFVIAYRCLNARSDRYTWVLAGGSPSFSPADGKFLGYLGDTDVMREPPNRPKALDELHHGFRSKHQIVMLDAMADHVDTARILAKHTDDASLKKILDYALLTIGDLLHKASSH